ncbi:hypothetical protein H310_11488 [Aphanomyces invadans]|uniref:5'-3' exoribonuclease 1 n=1 Tax=Aphanomyces invadans TaxID=157072 RepID=A0A024TMH9_9STRA|nr:hypothetical protein H310_11488 [Aphanomyces invadans]ETV94821.1 hypothetical protein H310_11488 [Aphanomyces invadans]|eukprot:XP_008876412.1 hypothetical protein H310_11488 [Aphanomyces invadans]
MGIPRFYRWISERYPQINQQISDVSLLPEFDNLYLDLNGIVHQCTHPIDQEVSEEMGEAHYIPAIFAYIDRIVTQIVKPKKLLFLAVDGVAPRAKLNQQRSRRFRAGKDLYEKRLKEANDGDESPRALFDSNCITPGTEFMYRLSSHLQYFIRKKLKDDPSWRNLTVIFSGQEVPGEGEHKIVEYIRRTKMQPGYPPNVRHCMYGSDADLMLLGVMTHEPHFTLVREVVQFGSGSRKPDNSAKKIVARQTKEQQWQLVHLSLFRQYLSIELHVPVDWFDAERALDDFIFLTFLLGNDFIPHSPTLDISEDAIALMLTVYRDLLPQWGDFLTDSGVLRHPEHLETLCRAIGDMEEAILTKRVDDEKKFRDRKRYGNGYGRSGSSPTHPHEQELDDDDDEFDRNLVAAMAAADAPALDDAVVVLSGSPAFQATKWAYYAAKFGVRDTMPDLLMDIKVAYVEALVWCAGYYFQGVPSWSWFYPFHYSPMLSDLTDIAAIVRRIEFDMGAPFLPFQQLLSTLPPTSASLVPPAYQHLMVDPTSPIAHFYPIQFDIDMNGKRNEWEGVNLLPFIDASLLVDAIAAHCPDAHLTDLERVRNQAGSAYMFSYDVGAMDTVHSTLPGVLDDIPLSHSRMDVYTLPPRTNFRCTLTDGVEMPLAGFPSLYSVPVVESALRDVGVNCFGMSSKKKTLVLRVAPRDALTLDQAKPLLGTTVFVNYPNLHEARVVGVSTVHGMCQLSFPDGAITVDEHPPAKQIEWTKHAIDESCRYLNGRGMPGTGGVMIGDVTCFLHVQVLQGMVVDESTGATRKKFGHVQVKIPYQLAVLDHHLVDVRFQETAALATPERFPIHAAVVLLHGPSRGLTGVVVGHHEDTVTVKVPNAAPEPPFGYAIAHAISDKYYSSYVIGQKLGISPGTLGRITGSLLVNPGRYDIGLNMKYKKELTLAGYCRYQSKAPAADEVAAWTTGDSVSIVGSDAAGDGHEHDGVWEYSDKAFYTILAYQRKFPRVFSALDKLPYAPVYDGTTFLGVPLAAVKSVLESIKTWLTQLDIAPLPLIPISSETVPRAAIKAIEKASDTLAHHVFDHVVVEVEPTALFRRVESNYDLSSSAFVHGVPRLGDRVVNLSARGVPFGLRGTVVATHQATACVEVVFDTKFSGGTSLSGSCSPYRGKLVQWATLLVVSTPPEKTTHTHQRTPTKQAPAPTQAPVPQIQVETTVPQTAPPPRPAASRVPNVVAPPPPSTDKMHLLLSKWTQQTKPTSFHQDLNTPANSMAQYFTTLQTRSSRAPFSGGPSPLPAGAPSQLYSQPPLPPADRPARQPAAPTAAPVKTSSGLLRPAQVLQAKRSNGPRS